MLLTIWHLDMKLCLVIIIRKPQQFAWWPYTKTIEKKVKLFSGWHEPAKKKIDHFMALNTLVKNKPGDATIFLMHYEEVCLP